MRVQQRVQTHVSGVSSLVCIAIELLAKPRSLLAVCVCVDEFGFE
jgi:hypothetical protein